MFNFRNVLGVRIDELDCDLDHALDTIMQSNSNIIIPMDVPLFLRVRKDAKLRKIVNSAALVIATDKALSKNYSINEFSLYTKILTYIDNKKSSLFIFGSTQNYVNKTFENLKRIYPSIVNVGNYTFLPYKKNSQKSQIIDGIRKISSETMVIDMKTPQNLLWYDENKNNLNTKLYLLSGKPFSVFSGKKKSPPYKVIQKNSRSYYYARNPFLILTYFRFSVIKFFSKLFKKS